jgi:hypothetical protein
MTAVELCARCAGDPRDGIGYHAFDCAEVAPKERVMTASEGLEDARAQVITAIGASGGWTAEVAGALGAFERVAGDAATSPLLARIGELEGALREMINEEWGWADDEIPRQPEHYCGYAHAATSCRTCDAYSRVAAALSSPSSIKEDVK